MKLVLTILILILYFDIVGERCRCGAWVTPAFHIQTNKVDRCVQRGPPPSLPPPRIIKKLAPVSSSSIPPEGITTKLQSGSSTTDKLPPGDDTDNPSEGTTVKVNSKGQSLPECTTANCPETSGLESVNKKRDLTIINRAQSESIKLLANEDLPPLE